MFSKTSLRRLQEDTLQTRLEDVLKTSWILKNKKKNLTLKTLSTRFNQDECLLGEAYTLTFCVNWKLVWNTCLTNACNNIQYFSNHIMIREKKNSVNDFPRIGCYVKKIWKVYYKLKTTCHVCFKNISQKLYGNGYTEVSQNLIEDLWKIYSHLNLKVGI